MKIHNLKLQNFRNHIKRDFDFNGKSTLILGENGAGKTNILEALHLLATTKSLRATFDREILSHDEDYARLETTIEPSDHKKLLEMVITKSQKFQNASSKKVRIDKVNKSLNKYAGTLNTVLFTPHDVEIFTSSPSIRRKHLDLLFFQIDKKYKKAISDYGKAIRQRNKLLEQMREFGRGQDQIDFWTNKVIENAEIIQNARKKYFEFVKEKIKEHGKKLNAESVDYEVIYEANEINHARLFEYADKELAAARTLIGPHRDDFIIKFNDYDVSKYGSRGQKRTSILALKLCEIDFIEKVLDRRPVLLLDDIFSELDDVHKNAVLNIIEMQQTIITSADDKDVREGLEIIRL